jgi:hypothetical protein
VQPYSVALVLDAKFGEQLGQLASRVHTWVVDSPQNRVVAEKLWASERQLTEGSIERGITTFKAISDADPEDWCAAIVGTIDVHHNELSHTPGYSCLEVYGLKFSDRLRPYFCDLGFTDFQDTDYGFRASKGKS